jgi:DNA primase
MDFYTEEVLPALAERLDSAFPEFGWRRDARGWVATDEEMTHRALGARAERVVAHGPAPRGFLVHGGESMLWTAYLNGGVTPRGEDFVRTVKEIAARVGVDTTPIGMPSRPDRRAALLSDFYALCQEEFLAARGESARKYLVEQRGLPAEAIDGSGLGVVPTRARSTRELKAAGYSAAEIEDSGIHADRRWPGRLCGAWRDERGRIRTLWARDISPSEQAASKYLYLRGASRTGLPPYGWSEISAQPLPSRSELLLVEGLLDVHHLRARGIANVAALGGTALAPEVLQLLARRGIETVTLCLDRDEPGRRATERVVAAASQADESPRILAVDPEGLAPANDPDELVRTGGLEALRAAIATRKCGFVWRALELLEDVEPDANLERRKQALARAGEWLGALPPRLALEQEDALAAVAERCGYSVEAVQRRFRTRYWRAGAEPAMTRAPESAREL